MLNGYDYSKILCNTPPETIILPLLDAQCASNTQYPRCISDTTLNNICDSRRVLTMQLRDACCANNYERPTTDTEDILEEGPIGLTILDCKKENEHMTAVRNSIKHIIKMTNREIAQLVIQILLILIFVVCSICGIVILFLKYGGKI